MNYSELDGIIRDTKDKFMIAYDKGYIAGIKGGNINSGKKTRFPMKILGWIFQLKKCQKVSCDVRLRNCVRKSEGLNE